MLTDLRVRDLGVIEELHVSFGPGMTALTGETGAGKTLLVEALQLVLGGRAASGLVRAGAAEAVVEARFEVPAGALPAWVAEPADGADDEDVGGDDRNGAEPGATREVILARSVPATGRSRAWLDGRMVPVSALGELAPCLVDIHGQHDHQSLLSPVAQRSALDGFAGLTTAAMERARSRLRGIDDQLARLGGDDQARAREIDMLTHQVGEIEQAALDDPDEDQVLRSEEEMLADLEAHRAAAATALGALVGEGDGFGGDGAATAFDGLAAATTALADRPPFAEWLRRLQGVLAEIEDVAADLRSAVEEWEDDPARLAEVQARRRLLADLRQRYGPTLADVMAFAGSARDRLQAIEAAFETVERLTAERADAAAELHEAEATLRQARNAAAPDLASATGERLARLAMAGARIEIAVAESGSGEPVQFLLGANRGEPVQPLAKVASGGELARAMLALRLVAMDGPATMIFDEVDAGVGGEAALALGAALHEVARSRQVLVVTHLAQVAAYADSQVAVQKVEQGDRTATMARALGSEERVVELSRMLSGHPDSPTARAHAEELLATARAAATGAASSTTGAGPVV